MRDLQRQELCELLAKHGPGLCDEPGKLEGLLKDLLRNEQKRETYVMVIALREEAAYESCGSPSGLPPAALVGSRMKGERTLTEGIQILPELAAPNQPVARRRN